MRRKIDLTGNIYKGVKVLHDSGKRNRSGDVMWVCECLYCGNKTTLARKYDLERGDYQSCGCQSGNLLSAKKTTHGKTKSKEYEAWRSMLKRCYLENNDSYKDYGERGITVCEEWKNSFESFYEDMGDSPTERHSLDRIDNEKGYYKLNCRWATSSEQACNRRKKEGCTTNHKGIHIEKCTGKYIVRYCPPNEHRRVQVGRYDTEEEAVNSLKDYKERYEQ